MSDQNERTEDEGRVSSDAPAEGAENPGQDETAGTPTRRIPPRAWTPKSPSSADG